MIQKTTEWTTVLLSFKVTTTIEKMKLMIKTMVPHQEIYLCPKSVVNLSEIF
jgi:hypothetical protein